MKIIKFQESTLQYYTLTFIFGSMILVEVFIVVLVVANPSFGA